MVYLFPLRTNSQLLALFFYYNMYFVFSEISIFLIPWHSRGLRIDLSIHYRKITFQIFRFCRSLPLYNMLLLCRITRSTFIVCIRFSRSSSSLSFCECYPARHYSVLSSLFFLFASNKSIHFLGLPFPAICFVIFRSNFRLSPTNFCYYRALF